MRTHGHMHKVRQAHERMPYLPAVRSAGSTRVQVLNAVFHLQNTETTSVPVYLSRSFEQWNENLQ